jgi:hypothetical protein
MRQPAARHLIRGLEEMPEADAFYFSKGEFVMKKQISIALAAGLLMAGASVASATEMPRKTPSAKQGFMYSQQQHNIYVGHKNSKGQQHAAVRKPWHNAE